MSATQSCHLLIRNGCEFIKSAKKKEAEKEYDEAVKLYANGIKCLMNAMKHDQIKNRQKIKAVLKQKIKLFLSRAEQIKKRIAVQQNNEIDCEEILSYFYPTHEEIQQAKKDATQSTVYSIHGYVRQISSTLIVNYDIPNGIVDLLLVYFHIPIEHPVEQFLNMSHKPNIKWEDVIGHESAKQAIKESVVLPIKFPQLFTNGRWPRYGILLFGPAGCGKTYLSNAIASLLADDAAAYIRVNLFNIAPSYGNYYDGRHFIKDLFQYAKEKGPSVIVIDEIDCLCSENDDDDEINDDIRRVRTELAVQMMHSSKGRFIVIGITNCPWNLGAAMRRRFDKRIYCGLPDETERANLLRFELRNTENTLSDEDYITLAKRTNGFSGADISSLVQGALMNPVRRLQNAKYLKHVDDGNGFKWIVCEALDDGAIEMGILDVPQNDQSEIEKDKLSMVDFEQELATAQASISEDEIQRFMQWQQDFCDEG